MRIAINGGIVVPRDISSLMRMRLRIFIKYRIIKIARSNPFLETAVCRFYFSTESV